MIQISPHQSISPVFAVDREKNMTKFLGSGYFVKPHPYYVTAGHVVRGWDKDFSTVISVDGETSQYTLELIVDNKDYDVAIMKCTEYEAPAPFEFIDTTNINMNRPVVSLEYSTTRTDEGKTKFIINPATRLGNITRKMDMTDMYGPMGEDILELSFPALKGASGSPVLYSEGFGLLGMIVANVEYHLLPQQILTVLTEGNDLIEDIKYLMPLGLAVNARHIKEILDKIIETNKEQ